MKKHFTIIAVVMVNTNEKAHAAGKPVWRFNGLVWLVGRKPKSAEGRAASRKSLACVRPTNEQLMFLNHNRFSTTTSD